MGARIPTVRYSSAVVALTTISGRPFAARSAVTRPSSGGLQGQARPVAGTDCRGPLPSGPVHPPRVDANLAVDTALEKVAERLEGRSEFYQGAVLRQGQWSRRNYGSVSVPGDSE